MMNLVDFDIIEFLNTINFYTPSQLFKAFLPPIIILLLGFILGLGLNRYISKYIDNHIDVEELSFKGAVIRAMKGVPLLLVMWITIYWTVKFISMSEPVRSLLSYILFACVAFTIIQVIARALTGMVETYASRNINIPKTTLLTNIINLIIYSVGILVILSECGISVTPIITAMGAGGIAVALGLQDTLTNTFAGLSLIASRQLNINDFVRLASGQEGRVADITWRYTAIESTKGNTVIIPNKDIANSVLTNFNVPAQDCTIKLECGVDYNSDLQRVEELTIEVAEQVCFDFARKQFLKDPSNSEEDFEYNPVHPPRFRYTDFGDSSINYSLFVSCAQFTDQYELRHDLIKAIKLCYDMEGINIPFPIRTILKKDLDNDN